jgi:hypothetical protein
MTTERLKEYAHGSFSLKGTIDEESTQNSCMEESLPGVAAIHYDNSSGCLAVSSVVLSPTPELHASAM